MSPSAMDGATNDEGRVALGAQLFGESGCTPGEHIFGEKHTVMKHHRWITWSLVGATVLSL
jgi:hypothetical protein